MSANTNEDVAAMDSRDVAGETVLGMRVAAYRETHPEHGAKYGHCYSEHWSTPNHKHPDVKVERLFTESAVRALLQSQQAEIEHWKQRALTGVVTQADVGVTPEARAQLEDFWKRRHDLTRDEWANIAPVVLGYALAMLRVSQDGGGE